MKTKKNLQKKYISVYDILNDFSVAGNSLREQVNISHEIFLKLNEVNFFLENLQWQIY